MEKKTMLITWATRKPYILASAKLAGMFLILTLILPNFGFPGIWMAILTGISTCLSLIYLFVHIYIISFNDCADF